MTPDDAELVRGWFARMDVLRPKIEAIPDDAPEADVVVELCDIASDAIAHLGKRVVTAATALSEATRERDEALSGAAAARQNFHTMQSAANELNTKLSEAKAENERLTRERDAFFDSLRQLICINSVLTALRSTAPLWLEHAERLIDERNALNPKGGDNEA